LEQYSGITAATFPLNCKQAAPRTARYLLAKAAGEFSFGKLWAKIAWMQFLTRALPIGARLFLLKIHQQKLL